MSLLVRDVSDFMLPNGRAMGQKEGIETYCRRLAGIYEDEEKISGMPIRMKNFRLFDEEHTSSLPLNLAYKAAELTAPEKAILELTEGKVLPARAVASETEALKLIKRRRLICSVELREAFDIQDKNALKKTLAKLQGDGKITYYPVGNEHYISII